MCSSACGTYPWLTKDFLLKSIQNHQTQSDVIINSFQITNASIKGESFASNMTGVTVNYCINGDSQTKRFLLKSIINNEIMLDVERKYLFLIKEIVVYESIMPKIELMLQSIGDFHKIAPMCYSSDTDIRFMLLENLQEKDYCCVDKRYGLDFDHLKLVLTSLAKWHATNAVLVIEKPELFELHREKKEMEDTYLRDYEVFMRNIIIAVSGVIKDWPGFETISEKFISMKSLIFEKARQQYIKNKNGFITLLHGDLWTNNLLFKYNDQGEATNVMLIDYALGSINSPGDDIAYLLFSSSNKSICEREWDRLIKHYHKILSQNLIKLNYAKPIPTIADIHSSFLSCSLRTSFACLMLRAMCKFSAVHQGEGFSVFMGESEDDCNFRYEMFANPDFRTTLEYLIDFYDRKGFFDF